MLTSVIKQAYTAFNGDLKCENLSHCGELCSTCEASEK